ncbi:MAG: major capsid protein [Candidatus Saccharimonadales bacterium]
MAQAIVGSTALTYADWAKRMDDGYHTATIIEILSQTNEILDDMLVMEGNLPTGHKTTIRTGIPQATWRLLNTGVPNAKSTTAQIVDTTGNLETYSVIDKDIADLNGNTAEFRLSEVKAFLQGMSQQVAATLIYGNQAINPERFTGFAPRYSTKNTANSQTANNVLDGGGTSTVNTSIWIVTWGNDTLHGTFPKGKITGLQHRDMGEWPVLDSAGNTYQAYRDHFKWEIGLVLRDWRYVARIANIDVTQLTGVSAANLINLLVRALYRLPTAPAMATGIQTSDTPEVRANMGRVAIYCNRVVRTYLDLQAMNKTNVLLRLEEFQGKVVTTFRGIPVRTCDAILSTEAHTS